MDTALETVNQLGVEAAARTFGCSRKCLAQLLRHPQEEAVCVARQSRATIDGLGRDIKRDIAENLSGYEPTAAPASTSPAP
jgi:hypothetical protein